MISLELEAPSFTAFGPTGCRFTVEKNGQAFFSGACYSGFRFGHLLAYLGYRLFLGFVSFDCSWASTLRRSLLLWEVGKRLGIGSS